MKDVVCILAVLGCVSLPFSNIVHAANQQSSISSNKEHVSAWNQFAHRLYILHQHQISGKEIYQKSSKGGYMGAGDFYREIKYYDKKSNLLLSRVLWEIENPEQIHEIEVFVYDNNGKLKRDFLAAFLPEHRNAPIQTLINFHYQNDELKSFRQFDASGEKIYERCEGKFFGEPLYLSLDETDFSGYYPESVKLMESEEYLACFGHTMTTLGDYANPLFGIQLPADLLKKAQMQEADMPGEIENQIKELTTLINKEKPSAKLFQQRGMAYHKQNMFEEAISDFNRAIELDNSLDDAYFGRGLSYGRLRMFDKGIADLSVYIKRNPQSSVAYTKRGVRRIWAGNYAEAEKDLKKAIKIDPKNAEAHDDLGVMEARKGDYKQALEHFKNVVNIDPSYSKGFHNLAMTYYILGSYEASLVNINKALELLPNDKNALLLKGETMLKLGRNEEAGLILDKAEFLPEGGWQERFSLE